MNADKKVIHESEKHQTVFKDENGIKQNNEQATGNVAGEVFQSNKFIVFGVIGVLSIGLIVTYLMVDMPILFVLIGIPVAVIFGVSAIKTKLIVEGGYLRYVTWARGEEVDLMKVSQIVTREVETFVNKNSDASSQGNQGGGISVGGLKVGGGNSNVNQERQVEKVVYVIDKEGRTFFSFPASMVSFKKRGRFKKAIHAVNPTIDVF